jgi:hypothetical protein
MVAPTSGRFMIAADIGSPGNQYARAHSQWW